ncbi:double-strand-break repair protein rad21-like protein 1 [Gouania willdenowi]|uniref:Double-strand-break repair protein rad21 homolog n=1 Tax=Gouania willdenowi TaxID=441366 RepID=A0A8C5ELM2_GOUWI|nr:double-strand-break repair protein rad21 homolog [Gouania willdenowi]
MLFYTQLFTSKRGPLAKIWLAAHWERKLTKAHVFECNLETSIRDIISPKMKIGLRTSGHLLLGVVRIYSRKAKYLLADCNDALVKIKIVFRPDQTDLPVEGLEATVGAITLVEDFTSFDAQLPEPSDIDVITDHFSLNQSRTDEITMKEDFGNNFLAFSDFGDESQRYKNTLLDMSFQSLAKCDDNFGDEGRALDLFGDFFTNSADHLDLTGFTPEEPQNTGSEVDRVDPMMSDPSTNNETTLLANVEEAFALEPVANTPNLNRRRAKRRRKLVVDQMKELSDKSIKEQLSDFSDLLSPLDLAPPTLQLMQWKENGGADKLFAGLCLDVIAPEINELFTNSIFLVKYVNVTEKVEEMRQSRQEGQSDISVLTTVDSSVASVNPEESHHSEPTILSHITEGRIEATTQHGGGENMLEFSYPELPSEQSLVVQPSHIQQESQSTSLNTQSLLGSQDFEERRINKRAQMLLDILKLHTESSDDNSTFSLDALCRGGSRSQAATTFACLLVLKKQQAVYVHQSAPYLDILVSPGPTFYD